MMAWAQAVPLAALRHPLLLLQSARQVPASRLRLLLGAVARLHRRLYLER